ncbi:MAG: hypothetical protein VZR00_07635 [Lachnospiraceae bacterium]|nr:hypothetical protein [Lachnospiraceae bacterium]
MYQVPYVKELHGQKDSLVIITGLETYVEKLTEPGIKNKLVEIPYCNHVTVGNESLIINFLSEIDEMSVK